MARSTQMNKIKEIIQVYESGITSYRAVGRIVDVHKDTVKKVISTAQNKKINYQSIKHLSDDAIYKMFYPDNTNIKYHKPEPNIEFILEELKNNKTLTIKMLWEEYLTQNPDGLRYTQFRERIKEAIGERNIRMHIDRKPGEKMYVDWAGDTGKMYDRLTGEQKKVYYFVATIGVSSYTYVEAFLNTKSESFIQGNVNALCYFDGLPKYAVPDNDKSAITKANRYEPIVNSTYQAFADHYGLTVLPARRRSPTDKPTVEKAVLDAAERMNARFRNMKFFSLEEYNQAIQRELKIFNTKPYQKERNYSRYTKYVEIDKPQMKPLPSTHFEYYTVGIYTVHMDSHIEINHKCYSVPYKYIGKRVDVKIGAIHLRIYYKGNLIGTHTRIDHSNQRFSTDLTHLPERHVQYLQTNKDTFIDWGKGVDERVLKVINTIFQWNKNIEEYAYRTCLGLKSLYRTYGHTQFVNACQASLDANTFSYRFIKNILDSYVQKKEPIIVHPNIRGASNYANPGDVYDK